MESFATVSRRSLRRAPLAFLIPVVPFVCAWGLALPAFLFAWLLRLMESYWIVQVPIGIALAIWVLPVGLLLFGSLFAGPLGWAAIANEKNPDALDSLSRGYESLLRRPLHLFGYLILAVALMTAVWCLTSGIAIFAVSVSTSIMDVVGVSMSAADRVAMTIGYLPLIVNLTLFWTLIGGVYLLARESTCEQHVEDLWVPDVHDKGSSHE